MATSTSDSREMIERWKAEHPELRSGGGPPPRGPRSRPAPTPAPAARAAGDEQREMIERWQREHATPSPERARPPTATQPVARDSDRRVFELAATPLTVLGAFIVGAIIGGIAMTIVTGIAFWGFSGG